MPQRASFWRALSVLLGLAVFTLGIACQRAETSTPDAEVASPAAGGELAAEINGLPITLDELDGFIKDELFRSRASSPGKLFEMRDEFLRGLIEERLLEIEAQRRGVSPDRLIQDEVAALGPVTDGEVNAFYEENKERLGNATLDQVSDRIRDYLSSRRQVKAAEALKDNAKIVIHIEAPRYDVAADGASKGPEDARVTIVEFSDFQCPYCKRVVPTIDKVLEKYPEDVRVVYRHMPLRSHRRARPAAEAALCAGDQDEFWAYHDKLFENARQLEDADLLRYAGELGLDEAVFEQCYEGKKFTAQVDADLADAAKAGITGTPSFVVNGILISGAKPPEEFYRVIDEELARLGEG